MSLAVPPTIEDITDQNGDLKLPWVNFFNSISAGDAGTSWAPTFASLTSTGTPTITGRYYRLSRFLVYFNILVAPATDTSSVGGTTAVNNFPLSVKSNGVCFTVAGALGGGIGIVQSGSNLIYPPTWTSVTVPVNIIGVCEAI